MDQLNQLQKVSGQSSPGLVNQQYGSRNKYREE